MEIQWAPRAEEKLLAFAEYIARNSPLVAQEFVAEITVKVRNLQTFPYSGHIVAEVGRDDIRELIHGKYRIIYKVTPDVICVLTIFHTRQRFDMKELLV